MVYKSVTKKKANEIVKGELLNSLQKNDDVEAQEFQKAGRNVNNSQETILIIRRYEEVIKT